MLHSWDGSLRGHTDALCSAILRHINRWLGYGGRFAFEGWLTFGSLDRPLGLTGDTVWFDYYSSTLGYELLTMRGVFATAGGVVAWYLSSLLKKQVTISERAKIVCKKGG